MNAPTSGVRKQVPVHADTSLAATTLLSPTTPVRFLAMPANARQSLSSVPRISRHALQPPQPLSSSLPPAFGRRR
uniref:Transmembrane 9 superfamily member n=1 Tax=Oryza nivara TaxID=4536 RepID=A0A0E0IP16_ORYNI